MKDTRSISTTASENGHFVGFPAPIYKWLQQQKKIRASRSIPAVVVDILREAYLSEQRAEKKAA